MSLEDDLTLEGEPEREGIAGIAASFPLKRVAAAALFRDPGGRVLLLEPTYKDTWVLPGGVVEENEDPLAGCRREVREELGLELPVGGLLAVDWVPRYGVWGDSLQFTFDGGVLAADTAFALQAAEIRSARWCGPDEWEGRLTPAQIRRYRVALDAVASGVPRYLTFGR